MASSELGVKEINQGPPKLHPKFVVISDLFYKKFPSWIESKHNFNRIEILSLLNR